MSTSVAPLPWLIPLPGEGQSPAPPDEDDGIHIVSVTPVERFYGAALLVLVRWFEDGRCVERELELPV